MPKESDSTMLEVNDLHVRYRQSRKKSFYALKGVCLHVGRGQTLGIVGESGSGKSTIGKAILGQVAPDSGEIRFDGEDITRATRKRRRELGKDLQVVFQDPYSSLNPMRTIGETLSEPLTAAGRVSTTEVRREVARILEEVGMPADTAQRYPSQFSGGQRQRIAIARAVIARPRLLICDEPVSALDLSVQAQVLNLLNKLQADMGMSMLFISHDLTVVKHISHRTVVLYQGEIVEEGNSIQVHNQPEHPYTQKLVSSAPLADPHAQRRRRADSRLAQL